jgi:hypothetical protein
MPHGVRRNGFRNDYHSQRIIIYQSLIAPNSLGMSKVRVLSGEYNAYSTILNKISSASLHKTQSTFCIYT